jgi:cell division protein FtsB
MAVLPPATAGCASCAARDAVITEQAAAIEELRADVVALAAEVRELRRRLGRNTGPQQWQFLDGPVG